MLHKIWEKKISNLNQYFKIYSIVKMNKDTEIRKLKINYSEIKIPVHAIATALALHKYLLWNSLQ